MNTESKELPDTYYTDIGLTVIDALNLRPNLTGKYNTGWGTKTVLGLGRIVARIVEDAKAVTHG